MLKTMTNQVQITSKLPCDKLSPFIESFWMMKNSSDIDEKIITFPDGGIDLYFFHDSHIPIHISLVGLETHSQINFMPNNSILCGVRLKLLAAEYLLHAPIAELINSRTVLNDYAELNQTDIVCFETFCEKLEQYFLSQLSEKIDPRKLKMSELVYKSKGVTTVTEVSEQANWSSRQINRYFNKWLGLPLKTYCDILRFCNSFESLKMGLLFPEEGFTDQSHYIKLIKKYSNLTPKQLAQGKNDRFIQLSSDS